MTTSEVETLTAYLDSITEETKAAKMKWAKSNPTTFVWKAPPPGNARLSLQKVVQNKVVRMASGLALKSTINNYIFQVVELPSGNTKLNCNTAEQQQASLREPLEKLFDAISSNIDREGLDFLKQVMKIP